MLGFRRSKFLSTHGQRLQRPAAKVTPFSKGTPVFRVHALGIEAEKFSVEFGRELANLPEPAVTTIVAKSFMHMSSYGFTRRNALRALATWAVFYGAGFERKDPQGVLQSICMSDKPAPERSRLFAEQHPRDDDPHDDPAWSVARPCNRRRLALVGTGAENIQNHHPGAL